MSSDNQALSLSADACAKCILFGEHSVVYGHPAIALPLPAFRLRAILHGGTAGLAAAGARDVEEGIRLVQLADLLAKRLEAPRLVGRLTIDSGIPGSGLGSSAALAVAVGRLIIRCSGDNPANHTQRINAAAYEGEKLFHGQPSGVDNTVVSWERPVWFRRGKELETVEMPAGAELVVMRTGLPSPTSKLVSEVASRLEKDPTIAGTLEGLGNLAVLARVALADGNWTEVGQGMNKAHHLLQRIGVSSIDLDRLVEAARRAGAIGAKLTGAGGGGNAIALTENGQGAEVAAAISAALPGLPTPLVCPLI